MPGVFSFGPPTADLAPGASGWVVDLLALF